MGEIFFNGMTKYFGRVEEREKLFLLARVERHTAEALHPLIIRYGLTPRANSELEPQAGIWMEERRHLSWQGLMQGMSDEYPTYVDQFRELEKQAPEEDLQALKILTEHEIILIEFATLEMAGNPDSLKQVYHFLNKPGFEE